MTKLIAILNDSFDLKFETSSQPKRVAAATSFKAFERRLPLKFSTTPSKNPSYAIVYHYIFK